MKKIIFFSLLLIVVSVILFGCIDVVAVYEYGNKQFNWVMIGSDNKYFLEAVKDELDQSQIPTSDIASAKNNDYFTFAAKADTNSTFNQYIKIYDKKTQLIFVARLDKVFDLNEIYTRNLLTSPDRNFGFGIGVDKVKIKSMNVDINNSRTMARVGKNLIIIPWSEIYRFYDLDKKVVATFVFNKDI